MRYNTMYELCENILDKIGTNLSIADEFEYFEVSMKTTKNDEF